MAIPDKDVFDGLGDANDTEVAVNVPEEDVLDKLKGVLVVVDEIEEGVLGCLELVVNEIEANVVSVSGTKVMDEPEGEEMD